MQFYATTDADSVGPSLHPVIPAGAYLISAASWWRKYKRLRVTALPPQMSPLAGDWGGFVITLRYRFEAPPFSLDELAAWYTGMGVLWGATMDYCCEPEITSAVRKRQEKTTNAAHEAWEEYKNAPFCWVPTIQGWEVEDYSWHAAELRPLIKEMHAHYGKKSAFRVGVGTLCKRSDANMVRRVVQAVVRELPGVPLHLWGVTHRIFDSQAALAPEVISLDSAAWNGHFGKDNELWKRSGMTRRNYAYTVALPAYRKRFALQAARPRNYEFDLEAA